MKRVTWINIALLAAVALLGAAAYLRPRSGTPDYALSALQASTVSHIQILLADGSGATLERSGAQWRLTAPFAARADTARITQLLAILEARTPDVLPAADLGRYDLITPRAQLTVDGKTFQFGGINTVTRGQYVMAGNRVYLVSPGYGAALPADAAQLVSRQLLAPEETPAAFELPAFSLAQQDGRWVMTPPAAGLSQDDFNRWVDAWRMASAQSVAALKTLDKTQPAAAVTLRLKTGEPVVFDVYASAPDLVLARRGQPLVYRVAAAQRLLAPPGGKAAK